MTRIMVVDDEPLLRKALAVNLRARGYAVSLVGDAAGALELAGRERPDLVLLDLGLPGLSGLAVIDGLRAQTSLPIIVLSARHSDADKIVALDHGADDYVTKPFSIGELLARVRATLRRLAPQGPLPAVVLTDHFSIDRYAGQVKRDGVPVRLTPIEWRIIESLVRNAGCLVTHQQLLLEVWGEAHGPDTSSLRVHLTNIRRKLEPTPARPRYFRTEPGVGYRFVPTDPGGHAR